MKSFAEIVAHLRAPNGCPWDREQTHESLRKHLLEESYEAISAIDSGDFADMREEFGDLLLQIVLQSQIANEERQFNVNQVIQGIHSKIVRRHPHVFGDLKLEGVDGVLANWEKLKEKERSDKKRMRKACWMVFLLPYPLSARHRNTRTVPRASGLTGRDRRCA